MTDISELTTEPAEDEKGYRHDDLEEGSKVVYEGEVYEVAGVGRSAVYLGHDPQISVREGGMELIMDESELEDDDGGVNTEDDNEEEETESVDIHIGGADESDEYCRVTVDGKRVAVTDLTQTEDGLELHEDDEVVMRLRISEGSGRAADAIRDAIDNNVGGTVTVTGTLVDWHDELVHISAGDE